MIGQTDRARTNWSACCLANSSRSNGRVVYAVAVLKTPLVVVMGHEICGAVKAATEVVTDNATFPGSIGPMVEPIIPAVLQAQREEGDLLDNSVTLSPRRKCRTSRAFRRKCPYPGRTR
ncbi:carbonic anhydrase [Qipengyuania spongiae]|uniref:Carbonic anhydrase n=1 Tax=Qipengyuania spongiae TaxID=2909673 RepID=A0ABY5SZJ0_9SPHN|nr:carbonic anhydrase [Qipengyuania spongiae]UVI39942.1 carbonic anhydrase [Qipengyuania spongiae]